MTVAKDEAAQKKEELLKARREKLSKWKKQKAEHDATKAKAKESEAPTPAATTAPDNAKLEERRKKLEAWKEQKRRKNEDVKPVEPPKKKTKKARKSRRIVFGDENASTDAKPVLLFRPPSIDPTTDDSPVQEQAKDSTKAGDIDMLDAFMTNLSKQEQGTEDNSLKHSAAMQILTDDESGQLNDAIDDDDVDQKQAAHFRKLAKMKQLKKVTEIKYDRASLEPFQKEFYIEQDDIRKMSPEEVAEVRLNMDNLVIKGSGCPNPVTRWSQLGLNTQVMDIITNRLNFKNLTPIQSQALPAIMSGRDVIGISKTGSGKTISYLLPLLRQIKVQRDLGPGETGPLGLIMAPTRELAQQIYEEAKLFIGQDASMSCICCTGGSELKTQIQSFKRGVKIVVATPGRFIDLLTINGGKLVNTRRITFVVIDEADRLFDMGFEPQITQIMKSIRPDKQCVLFSATFPTKLRNFAMRVLRKPLSITVNSANMVNEKIEQSFVVCNTPADKFGALVSILSTQQQQQDEQQDSNHNELSDDNDEKTIIFVASQQICDLVDGQLSRNGFDVITIHAGKEYQERINNLEKFKNTPNSILLCTEVMSRGLNVPEVSLVVIYNAIKTFAQYVHTTGRTARGDHHGKAISILDPEDLTAAYILTKTMRPDQLESHSSEQVSILQKMSAEFKAGLESGKYKLSTGFGGKGLDNLDFKRDAKEQEERQQYEKTSGVVVTSNSTAKSSDSNTDETDENDIDIPKLQYTLLKTKNDDGSVVYSAKVNMNDLPQLVRWEASKNTTLSFIKNETGCSVTNRGKYYPPGEGPVTDKDPEKLYLLVEGKEEKDIVLSIELLEGKVREGTKKIEYQTIKNRKF
ncbi:DEAD-box RNA helicase [Maudiozyma humilis]|uniref:ATP-dependent RNA helicase n=1 Tax=Maudiozyma humilis TaxID=51915 RepID=A0AAV5S2H5_MAUHU|nr:DEAD-box RNA helicase [Kazachstania humilis]